MSCCIEHVAVLTKQIKDVKENKKELAIAWFDLANAYGSLPHKVINEMLMRHHVPEKVQNVLKAIHRGVVFLFSSLI